MATDPVQLLRRLEPPVAPHGAARRGLPTLLEAEDFESLLSLAATGAVRSGRSVTSTTPTEAPLDQDQLERLSAAADFAEARGARSALVLLDGRTFTIDVDARRADEVPPQASLRQLDVDAVIQAAAVDSEAIRQVPPPGNGLIPPAVAGQIASQPRRAAG